MTQSSNRFAVFAFHLIACAVNIWGILTQKSIAGEAGLFGQLRFLTFWNMVQNGCEIRVDGAGSADSFLYQCGSLGFATILAKCADSESDPLPC